MVRPTSETTTVTMILAREPLPKTTAVQLFKSLFLARRSEEYIVKHYPENQMRTPMHMSMGQEFVPVGVCAALDGKADVFASYRSHAAFLAQTHDTDRFFSELYGRTSGTGEGKGGSMHLAAPDQGHMLSSGVVATQIPVAVGAAFANLRLGDRAHGRGLLRRRRGGCRRLLGERQFGRPVPAAGDVRLRGQRLCGRHAARGTPGVAFARRGRQAFRRRHLRGRQRRRRERLFPGEGSGREGPSRPSPGIPQHQVLPIPRACRHRHGLELGLSRPGDRRARLDQLAMP